MKVKLTKELIDKGATLPKEGKKSASGWNKIQLQLIGVKYPLQKGWKSRAIGREIDAKDFEKFLELRGAATIKRQKPYKGTLARQVVSELKDLNLSQEDYKEALNEIIEAEYKYTQNLKEILKVFSDT